MTLDLTEHEKARTRGRSDARDQKRSLPAVTATSLLEGFTQSCTTLAACCLSPIPHGRAVHRLVLVDHIELPSAAFGADQECT